MSSTSASGPPPTRKKIGSLQPQTFVWVERCIINEDGGSDWCLVERNNKKGWVNSKLPDPRRATDPEFLDVPPPDLHSSHARVDFDGRVMSQQGHLRPVSFDGCQSRSRRADPRQLGREPPPRRLGRLRCIGQGDRLGRRHLAPGLSALRHQVDAGPGDGHLRLDRQVRADRRGAGAGLRLAPRRGRARHRRHAVPRATSGLRHRDLECGAHQPSNAAAREALRSAGESPSALHNNCSGKHSGMLSVARALGVPTAHYVDRDHPVQVKVRAAVEAVHRRVADRGSLRHRRLLDPDLGRAALAPSPAALREWRQGRGFPPISPPRPTASSTPPRAIRASSPAPATSTPS